MKTAAIIVVVVLVFLSAWIASRSRNQSGNTAPNATYLGLRSQMLQSSRVKLGLPATSDSTQPWGVLMDWGVPSGTATVVAMSDGSASIYLSSGGGYIGGQSNEAIRKAAERTVNVAGEFQPQMHETTSYPLPQRGEVIFYVLTDSGIFTASASEEELKNNRHPMSKLANAAQGVVTQYLLMQDGK